MNIILSFTSLERSGPLRRRAGFVLISVLFFIAMISSLALVMTLSMNSERISSFLFFHRTQSELTAREGIEHARTLLTAYTSNSTLNWISMPGKIMISEDRFSQKPPLEKPLSSGVVDTSDADDSWAPFNLNKEIFNKEKTPFLNPQTTQPLYLKWIYIRQDGTREINQNPVYDPQNPLQARYAFWVDDESCRINVNQTWSSSTNNTNVLHHPSRIDLQGLEGISEQQANEIHQNVTNHPVLGPMEFLRLTRGDKTSLTQNHYSLTTRNHSSELNPWGDPKIVLTTQKNRAYGQPYLDILNVANTDPGPVGNINRGAGATILNSKYNQQSQILMNYMKRTDWPCAPGKSFVQKYGAYGHRTILTHDLFHSQ